MTPRPPATILFVTGMSGAGKSTVLRALEDLGHEVVDNLPVALLDALLRDGPVGAGPGGDGAGEDARARPLAIGIDSRTRGLRPDALVTRLKSLRASHPGRLIETLFVDCAGAELERRYAETRRRHPLALDRPAADGIEREREWLAPLRRWADHLVDTTNLSANDLRQDIRQRFAVPGIAGQPVLSIQSFGYARGLPRDADLVFDMRFLRNPFWDRALRPGTGLDADVAAFVAADPAYDEAVSAIEALLLLLIPRYAAEGKSYVSIAFGCTGGRHRSVHVAERVAATLAAAGHAPRIHHRNLDSMPHDALEGRPPAQPTGAGTGPSAPPRNAAAAPDPDPDAP